MDTKIKKSPGSIRINKGSDDTFPSLTLGQHLTYQKTSGGWGLTGFFEGYKLIFSATFNSTWSFQKLSSFFKLRTKTNPSIISELDVYQLFSPSAKRVWNNARLNAKKRKAEAGVEDIFLALLKEPSVKNLLTRLNVKTTEAETIINNYLKLMPALGGLPLKRIPFEAFSEAVELHNHKVGSLMLLGGLFKSTPKENILHAIFTNIGLNSAKLELFAVWLLELNHEFPPLSTSDKFLYCLRQAQGLEEHFGYFYEFSAIEAAVELSSGQTLKDLQHKKALQYLVKAGALAKAQEVKIISEDLVREAAKK